MRFARRFFVGSLPVTIMAVVVLMLATPAALANTCGLVLVFQVQPTTTQVQTAMTPAVVVKVENSQGYLISRYNGPVTLTYAVNPAGAREPANNVVDAVDGVATFPALTFRAIGFGFKLQASAKQATSSPSQPFNIVSQLVHCQPGQSCQTQPVSSDGTSGHAVASAASNSDVLTATAGLSAAVLHEIRRGAHLHGREPIQGHHADAGRVGRAAGVRETSQYLLGLANAVHHQERLDVEVLPLRRPVRGIAPILQMPRIVAVHRLPAQEI